MKRWFWSVSVLLVLAMLISVNAQIPGVDPPPGIDASVSIWHYDITENADGGHTVKGWVEAEMNTPGTYNVWITTYPESGDWWSCNECHDNAEDHFTSLIGGFDQEVDESITRFERWEFTTHPDCTEPWWSEFGYYLEAEMLVTLPGEEWRGPQWVDDALDYVLVPDKDED